MVFFESGRRSAVVARCAVTLMALALLAGCGFHLRGAVTLPEGLSPVQVRGASTELRQRLELFLTDGGARVTDAREAAQSVLSVHEERFGERVLSVDSQTGKAREFEITYRVSFEVIDADGTVILPQREVSLVRDYVFDPGAVIGKSRERGVLQQEMRRDAAEQIVRALGTAFEG